MNSIGQIVTWKLTSGVAFDVVKDIFAAMKNRLDTHQKKFQSSILITAAHGERN